MQPEQKRDYRYDSQFLYLPERSDANLCHSLESFRPQCDFTLNHLYKIQSGKIVVHVSAYSLSLTILLGCADRILITDDDSVEEGESKHTCQIEQIPQTCEHSCAFYTTKKKDEYSDPRNVDSNTEDKFLAAESDKFNAMDSAQFNDKIPDSTTLTMVQRPAVISCTVCFGGIVA